MAHRLLAVSTAPAVICLLLASCCGQPCCTETASIQVPAPVLLEALAWRLPASSADAVLGADVATAGPDPVLMTPEQDRAVRARAEAEAGVEALAFPTILAAPGQEATVFVGETHHEADDAWSGWSMRCLATPFGTGRELALDFTFTWRPAPADGLDRPALEEGEVRVRAVVARMRDGQSVLATAPAREGTGDRVAVVIRASTVGAP